MRELLRYAALGTIALVTAASCKKKDDAPTCRIITATDVATSGSTTNTTVVNFTYNNDGQISTLMLTSGNTTTQKIFNYSGNTIIINATQGGTFYGRDSVTVNAAQRITNFRHYSTASGSSWYSTSYEYDGNNNLLKSISVSSSNSTPSTVTYTSSNGDLVSGSDGSSYGYYTDKPYQQGDYFQFTFFINYGAEIVRNAHLLKSLSSGSNVSNFSYDFTDGRISKLTLTGTSNIETVTYQYQCN